MKINGIPHVSFLSRVSIALCMLIASATHAADDKPTPPQPAKHRITGLFSPDRQDDLRELVLEKLPEVKLVSIDYKNAEATFVYDAEKLLNRLKREQIVERFDNLLKSHSFGTFGVRPLCTIPRDKLTLLEIPVVGLDCKGCCLSAYEAIANLDGVEQATASFKDGLVTTLIDPRKSTRAKLEEALTQKRVELKTR